MNLINEDSSTLNYNKWVKGIASREFGSEKLFINSLFDNNQDKQHPNTKNKQNILPYPMNNLIPTLGNAIVNLQNSINILNQLKNNPVIKKESNSVHLEQSIKTLIEASKLIEKAANCVDNIDYSI
ncbi:MAG: hypothetical protein EBU90_06705 [Proteobacteria bacterium]|nr:hypothetical protein [Pseudomonadota bacterium]NBP14998.1 hypothetical protein [bacterium]